MSSYPNQSGSVVKQYTCNGGANQTWVYYIGAEDQPYMEAYGSPPGGGLAHSLCLSNYGEAQTDGTEQVLHSCNRVGPAMWYLSGGSEWSSYSLFHLENGPGSYSGQCLTTAGNDSQGSAIEEWTCNPRSDNQAFLGNSQPGSLG